MRNKSENHCLHHRAANKNAKKGASISFHASSVALLNVEHHGKVLAQAQHLPPTKLRKSRKTARPKENTRTTKLARLRPCSMWYLSPHEEEV